MTNEDKVIQYLKSKYTDKQIEIIKRINEDDWFMLILHGAVRSGKTMLNNDLFLWELLRVKENAKRVGVKNPMYILAAYSSGTLSTNILQELANKYGISFKFDRYNNFELFGVKVITTFTSTVRGIGSIRGMTSFGAYINEASLANKEVFDEIIKRCSGDGARIISDTNPDHPNHWLKVDYIDKSDNKTILAYNFTIFDNNFLSQRYIDSLIATTPTGTMSERGLYGRWVIGEGAIYADFDKDKHILSHDKIPTKDIERYIVGVDWGYDHYGSMAVIGLAKGKYYLLEENAYRHLHIDDWVEIAKRIADKYGGMVPFYCDSARPEYVDRLWDEGFNAMNADKAVLPGITEVATLIKSDKFYVIEGLERFEKEINEYVWNQIGDRPIDKMDDVMDSIRYAIYSDKMAQVDTILA